MSVSSVESVSSMAQMTARKKSDRKYTTVLKFFVSLHMELATALSLFLYFDLFLKKMVQVCYVKPILFQNHIDLQADRSSLKPTK